VAMDAGHWDEASTEGALLLALGEETGVRAGRFEALGWLAQMAFHRGDQVVQDELLAACADERATPGHDAGGITVSLWAEALAAEAAGDPATGARLMGDCFDLAVGLDVRMAQLSYGPDLARMAVAAGDRERARQVAAAVAPLASRAGVAGARGHALTCRGLADGSSDRLLEAADAFADAGRPLPQAQAVDAAAQLLAGRGADAKAAAARTDAVATYRRIGALRHVRRLEAQEGVSLTAERPATGWGSLTPTEATVAHLVAEGLPNAQIAERQGTSRRTVETHVSRLYRKLEVPNRVVLAAATQEHRATSR